jgi:hypothetical protein
MRHASDHMVDARRFLSYPQGQNRTSKGLEMLGATGNACRLSPIECRTLLMSTCYFTRSMFDASMLRAISPLSEPE